MATYTLISSNVLTASAASVTFSSIPATYTDLVLRISARNDGGANLTYIQFNSDTSSNYSTTNIYGTGSIAGSDPSGAGTYVYAVVNQSSQTASTFSSSEFYIPSYQVSQNKPMSLFGVNENNATAAIIIGGAHLWRNTAAITSINLSAGGGFNFVSGSSFYLYGISNA
jgi:hypothetical protein